MKIIKNICSFGLIILCVFGITACNNKCKTDYMVLVNKEILLPGDWESKIELVDVYTGLDETYKVEKKTAKAYEIMSKGITLEEYLQKK